MPEQTHYPTQIHEDQAGFPEILMLTV